MAAKGEWDHEPGQQHTPSNNVEPHPYYHIFYHIFTFIFFIIILYYYSWPATWIFCLWRHMLLYISKWVPCARLQFCKWQRPYAIKNVLLTWKLLLYYNTCKPAITLAFKAIVALSVTSCSTSNQEMISQSSNGEERSVLLQKQIPFAGTTAKMYLLVQIGMKYCYWHYTIHSQCTAII